MLFLLKVTIDLSKIIANFANVLNHMRNNYNNKTSVFGYFLATGDYLWLIIAFIIAFFWRFGLVENLIENRFLEFLLANMLAWAACAASFRLYQKYFYQDKWAQLGLWMRCFLVYMLLMVAFNGLIKTFFSRLLMAGMFSSMAVLQISWRLFFSYLLRKGYFSTYNKRRVWIASNHSILDFLRIFEQFQLPDVTLTGYFGQYVAGKYRHLGDTNSLIPFLENEEHRNSVDEIYCSLDTLPVQEIKKLIDIADNNLIKIYFIPEQNGIPFRKLNLDFLGSIPVFSVRNLAINEPFNRFIKRGFDLIFSFLVIVFILSWLTPIMFFLIKMDSRGPLFFIQKRSGENNKLFYCLKFRTMQVNAQANTQQATANDPRITKLGRFLRASSIDELPQFFNVLWGDMSVIGPRPHMESHTETYSKMVNKFMVRHLVKPGITGLSQALGLRGETSERNAMKHRVRMDIFYIENWSIWLDFRIIIMTIVSVFKPNPKAR